MKKVVDRQNSGLLREKQEQGTPVMDQVLQRQLSRPRGISVFRVGAPAPQQKKRASAVAGYEA